MLNKKKLLVRTAAGTVGIICVLVLVVAVFLSHSAQQFSEFQREHADAPMILTEAIRPIVADFNTSASVPVQSAGTKPPITDPAIEISSIDDEYLLAVKFMHGVWPYPVNRSFDFVVAADYPEEITSGTIPCGPRLRRHIAGKVGMVESHLRREFIEEGPDAPFAKGRITSNTLQLLPYLDRARELMMYQNWQAMDPIHHDLKIPIAIYSDYIGALALLRATLRGEDAIASTILVNMVRFKLLCLLYGCAHPLEGAGSFGGVDQVLFGVALTDDFRARAGLEQVAALLAKARLGDDQVKHLRGLQAVGWKESRRWGPAERATSNTLSGKFLNLLAPAACATMTSMLAPAAQAWAEGREDDYYAEIDRLAAITKYTEPITGNYWDMEVYDNFPPHFGREHWFNSEVDRLQIMVAIARYFQSERRWPHDIHQLVPRYLDGHVLNRKNKVWGIVRQPAGIYPSHLNPNYRDSHDNEYTRVVKQYETKFGRLPQSAEDLRAVGADDTLTSNSRRMFNHVPERPVLFGVQRQTLRRGNPRLTGEIERRIPPGADRIDVFAVECTWPEPELARPDILELINRN